MSIEKQHTIFLLPTKKFNLLAYLPYLECLLIIYLMPNYFILNTHQLNT